MKILIHTLALLMVISGTAQDLIWTGTANDQDFFNEQNWIDDQTGLAPISGTLESGIAINLMLQIENEEATILSNGVINLGNGSLYIGSVNLIAEALSGGHVEIQQNGYIDLINSNPLQNNVTINFNSGLGWVRTLQLKGAEIVANHIGQITVNQLAAVYENNLRLDNYYFDGTVVRSNEPSTMALTLYDDSNLQGPSVELILDVVHSGAGIANNMNDKAESLLLKKGFMVTLADNEDGTGKSKNYIASETDLIITELPNYLANRISFIRVVPWNWISKKGIGGTTTGMNNTWRYQWNNTGISTIDVEYAPMSWGAGGADDDADIELYKSKYKATHVMAFNESDNCSGQSGQYNNLCDTDVAVGYYKNLMKTGLRLVSPSCRESAALGWLQEFHDKANAQDIRIDVIAVHWYDWASSPANSPNADPNAVFNRFKNYLTAVHDYYQLPIWITEFNANPNRSNATNFGFMQLALPYLESLDYVERYAWFQPSTGVADYYESTGANLTNVGIFYKNQVSSPSIPEETVTADSNLDLYYNIIDPTGTNLLINGFFETGDLTGWSGTNIDILTNPYEGTTAGRIKANPGNLYQFVEVEPLASYNLSFFTKWYVPPSGPIDIQILNGLNDALIASQTMSTSTEWNFVDLDFIIPSGVTTIKVLVEKGQEPGWFIDNAVLFQTETLGNTEYNLDMGSVYPNPSMGMFYIKSESLIKAYTVYNLQGQSLLYNTDINSNHIQVHLTDHKRGIYLLNIQFKNGNQLVKKLIIE